jgi:hypothetical protein
MEKKTKDKEQGRKGLEEEEHGGRKKKRPGEKPRELLLSSLAATDIGLIITPTSAQ